MSGAVVWLTGLPGAGKSTLAEGLHTALLAAGVRAELLDGDDVREHLWRDLGFSKADRDEQVRRLGYVARMLARNDVVAIVAAVSPYREARDSARCGTDCFIEVHVTCPSEELARRDPKALYARAARGEVTGLTGVSAPYEPPVFPEVLIDTSRTTVTAGVAAIRETLECRRGLTTR